MELNRRRATEAAAQRFDAAYGESRDPYRDGPEVHAAAADLIRASGADSIDDAYWLIGRLPPYMLKDA